MEFLVTFSEKSPTSNFTKIHTVGTAMIQANMTQLKGIFRDYANALKRQYCGDLFCVHHHV